MKDGSVWIHELTWEDISNYLQKNDIVLVPIGSTEQHGWYPQKKHQEVLQNK